MVYNLLTTNQKQSVSLVYTALTASSIPANTGSYISNSLDLVLSKQRLDWNILSPMSCNVDAKIFLYPDNEGINHEFSGYVTNYQTKFLSLISSELLYLTFKYYCQYTTKGHFHGILRLIWICTFMNLIVFMSIKQIKLVLVAHLMWTAWMALLFLKTKTLDVLFKRVAMVSRSIISMVLSLNPN